MAYIAGIVDGEGCIGIYRGSTYAGRKRTGPRYVYYAVRVEVASTSKELIAFLQKSFPGQVYPGRRPNRKPYYRWAIASKKADDFLHEVYPYLLIKKEQAEVAFKFRTTVNPGAGLALTQATKTSRSKLYEELRALKQAA